MTENPSPPIPRAWPDKYGLHEIELGYSKFIIPNGVGNEAVKRAVSMHGKRHGKKFICRVVQEHGQEGVRVWRVPK